MNRIVCLFALCLFVLGAVAVEPKRAELKIDVYEWGADTVLVYRASLVVGSDQRCDTLVAKNGLLTYALQLSTPERVVVLPKRSLVPRPGEPMVLRSRAITTILFPGSKQRIQGHEDKQGVLRYTAKGSERYFSDAATVRGLVLADRIKSDSIDVAMITAKNEQQKVLFARRAELGRQIDSLQLLFLERFPSSMVSGELLRSARYSERFFDYEQRLSPKVRSGVFKEQIDRWVAQEQIYQTVQKAKTELVVGVEAPSIELPDSSGVVRRLDELRGKWVVIDFWGSWCGWCIKGIPAMKAAYAKHGQQVEFLGVACNDKPEQWLVAIERYKLPWINVFEAKKGIESSPVRYGVEGYPTKIVVDPQGNIALKVVGEDPNFYTQLARLITEK